MWLIERVACYAAAAWILACNFVRRLFGKRDLF